MKTIFIASCSALSIEEMCEEKDGKFDGCFLEKALKDTYPSFGSQVMESSNLHVEVVHMLKIYKQSMSSYAWLLLLLLDPFWGGWGVVEDHGATETGQLSRAWT